MEHRFVTSNADQGNGAVWNQVTQQHHPDAIHAVIVDPLNYQIAYLASDSGVYKTTDMGIMDPNMESLNLIYNDVAIDPVKSPTYLCGFQRRGLCQHRRWQHMGKHERGHTDWNEGYCPLL